MTWQHRNPAATLAIHTKNDPTLLFGSDNEYIKAVGSSYAPINDVISITTTNSINESAGTFTIELVWRTEKVPSQTIINDSSHNNNPLYYKRIRPMDIVDISLDSKTTTMIGIITNVKRNRSISANKPKRSVIITGKALGAIWDFDLVKYFEYATGLPRELLERNLNLQLGNIKLDFFGENAIVAIKTLYQQLPALDITYSGGTKVKDFIDVGSELYNKAKEKQYNLNLDPYSGTLFDYFLKYVGRPFNEIWTESRDHKLYLRMRPTPFSVGEWATSTVDENNTAVDPTQWEGIVNWHSGDSKETSHIITNSDVIEEDVGRTHAQSLSIFGVLPQDKLYGNVPEYQALPPLIVPDLYRQFGSRDSIIRIGFIPILPEGGLGESAFDIFEDYRNLLYLWNKDNHRLESGTMIIAGRPKICVGDKISFNNNEYYTTGAQHTWTFGAPMRSILTVERGMEIVERKKRFQDGVKFLNTVDFIDRSELL